MDQPMTLPSLPDQIRQQLQTATTAPPNGALQEAISSVKKSAMGRNDAGFNLARNLRDKGFTFEQARQLMLRYQAAVTDLGDEAYTTNEAIASLQQAYKGVEEPWPIERLAAADPPSLTPDLLPENVRPFAVDLHKGMSVPFDFVALGMLVAAAGALGRRLLIEPNRRRQDLARSAQPVGHNRRRARHPQEPHDPRGHGTTVGTRA